MTMTPLERAARALYERDGTIYPIVPPGPLLPWDDLTEESKAPWINEARAVLTAIREPSEAMLQQGFNCLNYPCGGREDATALAKETWEQMLDEAILESDAALAEGE